MGARYYGSTMGRFMSPDPSGLAFASIANPQSLNLYSYVLNNPLINTDPTGMECVWDDGSYDSEDDEDTGSVGQCQGQGGTWIELGQNGNWSGNGNGNLQQAVSNIQSGYWNAVGVVGANGATNYTFYNQGVVSATDTGGWLTAYQYSASFNGNSTVINPSSASPYGTQADPGGQLGAAYFSKAQPLSLDPNDQTQRIQQLANGIDFAATHPFGRDLTESCQGYSEFMGDTLLALSGPAGVEGMTARAGYQSAAAASATSAGAYASAGSSALGFGGPVCKALFH
jgi:hypothetical protein